MTSLPEISPPNPLRAGEGRPAAATFPEPPQGGGGRLKFRFFPSRRSQQSERAQPAGYWL